MPREAVSGCLAIGPELGALSGIGDEPMECGQVCMLSPGGQGEHPSLFRMDETDGLGSGRRVLNSRVPTAFKESIPCVEQNLYARAMHLMGDRVPQAHEFFVQPQKLDSAKTSAKMGIASLNTLSSALWTS